VEFVIGICMMDSDKIEDKINIAFSLFDSDRSGYIDRVEVRDLLRVGVTYN
jgi:Ca2+-binding EF-hand superfamily protein